MLGEEEKAVADKQKEYVPDVLKNYPKPLLPGVYPFMAVAFFGAIAIGVLLYLVKRK